MGALMRAYDWHNHPLGDMEAWPLSLKTTLRTILNSSFPMFLWWSESFYMFHNDAYLPALGKKHPDALGASARDMWSEIWYQIGAVAEDIFQNGTQFYAEDMPIYLDRKGFIEETYWTFSYSPAFNDDGQVAGMFCSCKEVTDTVLNQRRLKTLKDVTEALTLVSTLEEAGEKACAIMSENTSDIPLCGIYLLEEDSGEARLLGQAGIMLHETLLERPSLKEQGIADPLLQVLETRKPVLVKYSDLVADKTKLTAEQQDLPVALLPVALPGQSRVVGIIVAGTSSKLDYNTNYEDFHMLLGRQIAISFASVHARSETERRQAYMSEIFMQAPVGITILRGPEYIVDLVNPGICEIWGRTYEEVIGRPVLEALPEVADQGIRELLDGVYTTGVPFVANELLVKLDRNGKLEDVYINFVYQPMRDEQGNVIGIIAVAVGVNEQVEARLKIEAMNKELLATNADLDNFVYSASHDLKAPISNIEGLMKVFVDFLPHENLNSPDLQKVLSLIQHSIDRFKRAIADLTEVAKVQREDNHDVARVNLKQVVEDIQLDFEPQIKEKQATIETNVSPEAEIEFSAKNVRSIVYNLLSNALKYSSPARLPHIVISSELTPEFVILSVADNGLGLNPDDEIKIFSMFKRLHDHVEGSGIGLYIVKRIIENAGGHIELETALDKGANFKVYFKR
ncbi:PAS domain-containing protein [Pontibacter sp. Tf4]|nr:PAS domain-containing protein [Pontibacter sp. Tf4]